MSDSGPIDSAPIHFQKQEEIDAAKRALRVLLDSFHIEPESELPKLLNDKAAQKRVGLFIAKRGRNSDRGY